MEYTECQRYIIQMEAILKNLVGEQWDELRKGQIQKIPAVLALQGYNGSGDLFTDVLVITIHLPGGIDMNFMLDPKTNVAMINNDPYQNPTNKCVSLSDPKAIDKLRYEVEGCLLRDRLVQRYDKIRKRELSEMG